MTAREGTAPGQPAPEMAAAVRVAETALDLPVSAQDGAVRYRKRPVEVEAYEPADWPDRGAAENAL